MKLLRSIIFLVALSPSFVFAYIFTENLSLGSTGQAVFELQKILNSDKDTIIAESGPGSTGQETERFGSLTRLAVIKFQEKYRGEVLSPVGLSSGTGVVGALTRQKMASLRRISTSSVATPTQASLPAVSQSVTTTPARPVVPIQIATTSPASSLNQLRFDQSAFLRALDTVGAKQGFDQTKLASIKEGAKQDIVTQNPEKKFIEMLQKGDVPIHGIQGAFKNSGNFFTFLDTISEFFTGKKAYAMGGTPFGGRVLFPFYCTCSGNWLITISPLPPTYVVLLTYYQGTQMYMGYNLPFTLNVLGEYTSGSQCQFYVGYSCISLPSEGAIGPTTGSSAI